MKNLSIFFFSLTHIDLIFGCQSFQNAVIMSNAETNERELLRVKRTNCIWRDSWVILVRELHADASGSQYQRGPFVKYWRSVSGRILNSAPLSRLFIYLLVQAVNPLYLQSVLAAVRFYLSGGKNQTQTLSPPFFFFFFNNVVAWIRWQTNRRKYCNSVQTLRSYRWAKQHHLFRKSLRYFLFCPACEHTVVQVERRLVGLAEDSFSIRKCYKQK